MNFTPLSNLGEFGLIQRLTSTIDSNSKELIKGVGDDAAVVSLKNLQVITTDTLNEGVHFDLMYTPLKHLGYKAAIVNFSDIYAMNAMPKFMLISLALTNKVSVEMLDDFYEGLSIACKNHDVTIIGGDTTSANGGISINVTVIGEAESNKLAYRNNAKINDLICVSGNLGAAYAGLQVLEREKNVFTQTGVQPDLDPYSYICERFLKPEARRDIIIALEANGIQPNAMIDISDGLSAEINHICFQSKVGCRIYEDKIPMATETLNLAEELSINSLVFALNGGEDYELLFTVPVEMHEQLKKINDISVIGHITNSESGIHLLTRGETLVSLNSEGWNAF